MATKNGDTNYVRIKHRMSDDEKRLFRLLFEYAVPEFYVKKEHAISSQHHLQLWAPEMSADLATFFLERAFLNLGATLTYNCTVNPQRHAWGGMALFNGRSIKDNGTLLYSYNPEFKKMINTPIVCEQLMREGLIVRTPEKEPVCSKHNSASYMML